MGGLWSCHQQFANGFSCRPPMNMLPYCHRRCLSAPAHSISRHSRCCWYEQNYSLKSVAACRRCIWRLTSAALTNSSYHKYGLPRTVPITHPNKWRTSVLIPLRWSVTTYDMIGPLFVCTFTQLTSEMASALIFNASSMYAIEASSLNRIISSKCHRYKLTYFRLIVWYFRQLPSPPGQNRFSRSLKVWDPCQFL